MTKGFNFEVHYIDVAYPIHLSSSIADRLDVIVEEYDGLVGWVEIPKDVDSDHIVTQYQFYNVAAATEFKRKVRRLLRRKALRSEWYVGTYPADEDKL